MLALPAFYPNICNDNKGLTIVQLLNVPHGTL